MQNNLNKFLSVQHERGTQKSSFQKHLSPGFKPEVHSCGLFIVFFVFSIDLILILRSKREMRKYNGDRIGITNFLKKYGNKGKEEKIRFREPDVKGLNL